MEKIIPDFFNKKIQEQYEKEEVEQIIEGLKQDKKTTFRVNLVKSNSDEIAKTLEENGISYEKSEYYDDVFILESNSEEIIKKLDIYQEGKIYLQSLSSMIPVFVLDPKPKENILDMCAAPRWKNFSNS